MNPLSAMRECNCFLSNFIQQILIFFKIKLNSEAMGGSARRADLTIRLVVKVNSMSARNNLYHIWGIMKCM